MRERCVTAYWKRVGDRAAVVVEFSPDPIETLPRRGSRRVITSRCRPVQVLAVDEARAKQHKQPLGYAEPIIAGLIFPSAAAASEALGYSWNAVAVRISQ